ncbi:MAG: GNAT family protein [Opitutaceae bacterium]|jgi:RimJ/RimL family protein N-acetyltransferase
MMNAPRTNPLGQPVGAPVKNWAPPPFPSGETMDGRFCRLERLDPSKHGRSLFTANSADLDGAMWTYLPYGPFSGFDDYLAWLTEKAKSTDPLLFSIVERASDRAIGLAGYLRIDPAAGSIEVGHLAYSPALQKTSIATEAMYLMMKGAFELGYRRYEWKCDALNAPSRAAALRLGFVFEGIFRQATVVKGRNRDTAWFSILDGEWPRLKDRFVHWLSTANFDEGGRQKKPLAAC